MGYVAFPIIDGERNTTPVWGQCAAASAGTAYPRQVYTWINYLSHHWLTRSRSTPEELAQFPARQSAAEKEGFWNYLPEHIRDTVSYIIHHPYIGSRYPKEHQAVRRAAESVLSGEKEPLSALAAAESEIAAASVPLPPEHPLVVASPGSSADSRIVDYYYQGGDPEQLRILASLAEQFNRTQTEYKVAVSERLLLTGDYGSVADNIFSHADCATLTWMDASGLDLVLDLSPFFATEPDLLQDYDSGDAARYTVDGKMIGLPAYKQPVLINYNPALLDKAGIGHPSWEWSYGDFLDAITRTADPDAGIYGYLYSGWDNLLSQAAGVNMILPGEEPTRPDLDTAALQIYLAFLEDLNKSGVLLAQNPGEPDAVSQALVSGKVAFWIGAAGEAGEWFLFPDQHIDYPYGQVVFPEGGQGIDILLDVISSAHYISAASQSPETCWGWFDFLSRQVGAFPGLPARRSIAASPEWEAFVGSEMAQNLRRAVENSLEQTSLDVEIIKPIKGWIIEAEQQVLNGDSPTAVAQSAGLKTDAYLACIQDQDLSVLERQALLKSIWNCAAQAVD
jgi:ABC-type glycerol-3-phosphate transport system substrate-binding protein